MLIGIWQGLQKSLFFKDHTAEYKAGDDKSWTVTVQGSDAEPFTWKGVDNCPEHSETFEALKRDLINEAKCAHPQHQYQPPTLRECGCRFSLSFDEEEIAMNRAKLYILKKCTMKKPRNIAKPPAGGKKVDAGYNSKAFLLYSRFVCM